MSRPHPLLLIAVLWAAHPTAAAELRSPDGKLALQFRLANHEGARNCLVYEVAYEGKAVMVASRLGLEIDGSRWGDELEIVTVSASEHDGTWKPVYGERSVVQDRYRQAVAELRSRKPPLRVEVTFRAYDAGAAFCYAILKQDGATRIRIDREMTEFRFASDAPAWEVTSAQGFYRRVPLSRLRRGCERPLVVELGEDLVAAVAEARLVDYARMKFSPIPGKAAVVSDLASEVKAELPMATPWRVVMVAPSPARLLEQNDLLLNLNDPCAIADTSWIKPGKVIREVTLTTQGGKACVDFAAAHGLQYVEFDAGWYGPENSDESDATRVSVDPKRSQGPLDLAEVIRHADTRGIGILLYVNRRALERQLDQLLPLYRSWGVKGMKFGFVQVGSQQWTSWLHEAVRKAAAHRLMVDIHDEYRPTGYSRTYPNLMTQEGIGGDETRPKNDQTLSILFPRMLSGAGDHTICYFDPRVDANATHAYQLAKAVCLYSPWQFLYWYDRPSASKPATVLGPNVIGDELELEFFDRLPTVWDDTRVLEGRIGRYAVLARRKGAEWFLGAMNDGEARTLEVKLDFLDPALRYVAHRYRDDSTVPTRTHVRIEPQRVEARGVLKLSLPARGGEALRISPEPAPQ